MVDAGTGRFGGIDACRRHRVWRSRRFVADPDRCVRGSRSHTDSDGRSVDWQWKPGLFNLRDLNWRVVAWFALGGVPMALLGGYLFATTPLSALTRLLGAFLLLAVVWRHLRPQRARPFPVAAFAGIGAGASFLSALLGSVGPVTAPFFLVYGLVKGAYIGTEALSTVVMHVTKLVAYRQTSILTRSDVIIGLALGPIMILGSFLGKRIVDRLPERVFVVIIETVLVIAGLTFLVRG